MQVIDEVASLVEKLTPDFIKEFSVYLSNNRGLASSTIWLSCMHLKGVVGRAHDNGKIQCKVFAQFHISPKSCSPMVSTIGRKPSSTASIRLG